MGRHLDGNCMHDLVTQDLNNSSASLPNTDLKRNDRVFSDDCNKALQVDRPCVFVRDDSNVSVLCAQKRAQHVKSLVAKGNQ